MFQRLKYSSSIVPLIIGFSVLAALFLISWVITSGQLKENELLHATTEMAGEKMEAVNTLIRIARTRTRLSHDMLVVEDVFERDEIAMEITSLANDFVINHKKLTSLTLTEQEKTILDSQRPLYQYVIENLNLVADLALEDTDEANDQAVDTIVYKVMPAQDIVVDGFGAIMQALDDKVHADSHALVVKNQGYRDVRFSLLSSIILVSIFTFIIVTRNVLRTESKLRDLSTILKKEKETAEQANIAKSRFLAAASHDLRQPLHALTFLFDAVKSADSDATRNTLFPKVDLSLDALGSLFNALLDISKLDAGAVDTHLEHFHIFDVLQTPLEEFSTEAKNKGLELRIHCNDFIVYSDKILLERIARNIISNAIRYTNSGGILISCRRRKDRILFQVWDTGIGIDANHQEEVFKEFHQIDNQHRDRTKGLGLGLSIVKRVCDILDYAVDLRSSKSKGTVVSLLVPVGDFNQCLPEDDRELKESWSVKGLEVLLIDDDINVLEATTILLEKWGCNVTAVTSAVDAADKIDGGAKNPDLILSDLRLPDGANGIDVIDSICSKLGIKIPAILITGDTEPERIAMARDSGYKVLHKPLKPANVRATIHQLIG